MVGAVPGRPSPSPSSSAATSLRAGNYAGYGASLTWPPPAQAVRAAAAPRPDPAPVPTSRPAPDLGLRRPISSARADFVGLRGVAKSAPRRGRRLRRLPGPRRGLRAARRTPQFCGRVAAATRRARRHVPARARARGAATTAETVRRRRGVFPVLLSRHSRCDRSGVAPKGAGWRLLDDVLTFGETVRGPRRGRSARLCGGGAKRSWGLRRAGGGGIHRWSWPGARQRPKSRRGRAPIAPARGQYEAPRSRRVTSALPCWSIVGLAA